MADDTMSEADKIRAKRLAKLGGSSAPGGTSRGPSTPSASTPNNSSPKPSEIRPPPSPATPSKQAEPPKANPFDQLGMKPEQAQSPRINIKPKAVAQNASSSPGTAPKAQESNPELLASWEHQTLSSVFRTTLDEKATRDIHGHRVRYVPGVKADLEEANSPARFTVDTLDQTILEAASIKGDGNALDYLLGCWKRISRQCRSISNKSDPKYDILQEARRLCFSYCIFAATMPDMFGEDTPEKNPLTEHLLLDGESDRGLCHDFFVEAIARLHEDESVKDVLIGAIEQLSRELSKKSLNDDYRPYVHAMRNIVRYPQLLGPLVESPLFCPKDIEPQKIETRTLLGPFFRLSPMQAEVALNYFSSPTTRDKGYITNSQRALRMTLSTHQDEIFDIANCLVKNKDSRERILDWFALIVNTNHKRRAMQVDQKTVSSDGFMVNVTVILDKLCEPFMDATFSKIDRIDIDYLRRSPRVRIDDETKINVDQQTSDNFYSAKAEGTNNFITEIFFLTVAAHHYGTEATNTKLTQLQRDIKHLEKRLAQFELERHKFAQNPAQLAVFEAHLKKFKDQLEKGQCTILAIQGVLSDDITQSRSMLFMRYVIVWILKLASRSPDYPRQKLHLPLPKEQADAFKCLPEYFLEDIVDNFKFITRHMPHIIISTQAEELQNVCIAFLTNTEYIKNPYLKSGLVTILFHGVWPVHGRSKGVLGDGLFGSKFANKYLLHALMKFYIECESTGTHTQFYDKFNIRYEIFQVIKCIWGNSVYRENLSLEATTNVDFFVHFVNLLLNDVTYVLDESFSAFKKIHELTNFLKTPAEQMDATLRQEKEEALSDAQNRAKSYMQLTTETVSMLKLFTEALSDSFTMPEVVQRLADMLDYNLDALVGPKKSNLKVENADEYGWNPRAMLADITDVYLNLKEKTAFVQAVAADGRSYKPENFSTALNILKKFALKAPEQLNDWEQLSEAVRVAKEEAEMAEQDLGEIPDEFLDPLLYTLMEDPVILPTSRLTIDRSTIRGHLLSEPTDPFNRVALTIDQVIPNDELREKIQAFKAERKAQKLQGAGGGATAGEPMDTS